MGGRRGAKISISDFHILKALIYLALGLVQTGERREEGVGGRGGGGGQRVRALMTFSLWNPISIVSAVNMLPKRLHMPAWPHRLSAA